MNKQKLQSVPRILSSPQLSKRPHTKKPQEDSRQAYLETNVLVSADATSQHSNTIKKIIFLSEMRQQTLSNQFYSFLHTALKHAYRMVSITGI